jgi:hypothetical protein
MNGSDLFSTQPTTAGGVAGPRLDGTLFVPVGMGVAFKDTNGNFWQQRLAINTDGTTVFDENGFPTLEVVQVNI